MEETSDENGAFILLLKYDKNGKLRSKISIAGGWGDAGDSQYSYGKWLKNNTFTSTLVYNSVFEDDIETSRIAIDSLIIKFSFQSNSKLKIDTLLNKSDTISQSRDN